MQVDQQLTEMLNASHVNPGVVTIGQVFLEKSGSAGTEYLRCGRLAVEEGFSETLGEVSHCLDRADEVAEPGLPVPLAEFDVGRGSIFSRSRVGGRCSGMLPRLPSITARSDQSTSLRYSLNSREIARSG